VHPPFINVQDYLRMLERSAGTAMPLPAALLMSLASQSQAFGNVDPLPP
jgi:hypothetical protein